jgi:hypothetical protein
MTDEERRLIEGLADRIRSAPAPQVDRDADDLIRRTIGSRPDALYILTQTALIQEMALNQAKAQIEELKRQSAQPGGGSFLGSNQPARSWGNDTRVQQPGGYQGSSYQSSAPPPQPQYAPPQYAQPQYEPPPPPSPAGGRFSGFLHNAAQTAAGVVAGEVAFSALTSLFGHHGGGGSGFFGGGGYGVSPGSETIINNYYEEDRGREGDRGFDRDSDLDRGLSPDLEDRRFAGDDSDTQQDDQDDTDVDDGSDDSFDDDSSYDDGSDSSDV